MFTKITNILLREYQSHIAHLTPAIRGPSAIMNGSLPSGFKGSVIAGIAPGREIPLKIKKKKIKKKKA